MELDCREKKVLREFFLFRNLNENDFMSLAEKLKIRHFAKGDCIYSGWSFRRSLAVLLRGGAEVFGHGRTLLNRLSEGDCFGAAVIFAPDDEYLTEVRASEESILAFLPAEDFSLILQSCPGMAMDYIRFLSGRIQFLNRKIASFTSDSTVSAVRDYLMRNGRNGSLTVTEGYSSLAMELNMGRASLYRALNALEKSGEIVKNGAEIIICGRNNKEEIL